jgi:hypothetical protein
MSLKAEGQYLLAATLFSPLRAQARKWFTLDAHARQRNRSSAQIRGRGFSYFLFYFPLEKVLSSSQISNPQVSVVPVRKETIEYRTRCGHKSTGGQNT